MRLFERIANTGVTRGEDLTPRTITVWRIKLYIHEFIHISHY